MAGAFRHEDYPVTTGKLSGEPYGMPQTRRRAEWLDTFIGRVDLISMLDDVGENTTTVGSPSATATGDSTIGLMHGRVCRCPSLWCSV